MSNDNETATENEKFPFNQLEKLLTCPICLDRFKIPKLLPCQHTYCLECLENMVNYFKRIVKCPECRAENILPYKGVETFPNNLTILSFLELPSIATDELPNLLSQTSDSPTQSSHQREFSSISSYSGKQGSHAGGDSRKFSIGSTSSSTAYPVTTKFRLCKYECCEVCQENTNISKCLHCDRKICQECVESHRTQLEKEVIRLLNNSNKSLPKVGDTIGVIEKKLFDLKNNVVDVKKEIKEEIGKCIQELNLREVFLLNEVDELMEAEIRKATERQNQLESQKIDVEKFCKETEEKLDINKSALEYSTTSSRRSVQQLIDLKKQLTNYIEQIREMSLESIENYKRIKFIPDNNMLHSNATHFGELHVRSVMYPSSKYTRYSSSRYSNLYEPPTSSSTILTSRNFTKNNKDSFKKTDVHMRSKDSLTVDRIDSLDAKDERIPSTTTTTKPVSWRADDRNEVACDVSSVGSSAVQSKKLLSCRDDDDLITINNKAHCASNANSLSGIKVPKSDANDHSHHFPFLVANSNSNNNNYNCDVGSYLLSKKANTCLASLLKAKKLSTKGKLTSSRSTNCSKKKSELLMFIETYTLEEIASSHGEIAQEEVMATVVGAKSGCHSNNNRQKEENNDSSSCSSVSELDGDDYEDTKKGTCDIYNDSSDTNAIGSITEFDDDDDEDVSQDKEVCEEFEGDDEDGDRTSSFGSVGDTEELIVESLQDKESNDRDDGGCGREETFSIDSILNGYETRYVKKFLGKKGSALGEFCSPLSLAISPNQDFLYIADSQNNRVQYLNAQHDTFKSIKFLSNLRNMSASKQFSHPSSVCVAKSGNIAIADTGNHRVVIADNIGRSILDIGQKGTINSRFMHPSSVTFDNMNFLYVCDEMNKRIQVFSADGRFVGKWGGGNSTVFSQPTHIACYTPNQTLYVIDKGDHSIKVFDRNGMKINCIKSITESALEEASLPMNIFSDERDSLHVLTNTNKIQTLSCDGSLISSVDLFPKEELSHCRLHDVVFWQKKFVVSDKENHRIIFF